MRPILLLLAIHLICHGSAQGESKGWPDVTDPRSGMGINIHFIDAKPGELEMLKRAGFRWIRMDFNWEATEKTAGIYDFSAYDRLLGELDQYHIRALLILDYANPLYDGGKPSYTDEGRAAFARWATAAVTHFKDRGAIWEIWNEPNGDWFWKPKANAEDYAKLALTVSHAIRLATPGELIFGPALNGTDLAFVEVSAKAGVLPYWSGITIHPYLRDGPESYGSSYQRTRQLIQKYVQSGQQIDVMCGESGYATTWTGISEATQGKYLARIFLFDVLMGVPLTIWYDWSDDGSDPKNQEHHFGIVHHDYHAGVADVYDPKPAYQAAVTYTRELSGFKFKKRVKTDAPKDYVLVFTNGKSECLVAWTSAQTAHTVAFPVPDGFYTITTYNGRKLPEMPVAGGTMHLRITDGPYYLKLKPSD